MQKMFLIFFHLDIKMATQKLTVWMLFLMHTDVPSVRIQSNKIVPSKGKDN